MTIFRIRRWLRWLLDLTAVLIAENAFLGVTWSFCVIGLMTVFAFADASAPPRARSCACCDVALDGAGAASWRESPGRNTKERNEQ
ncbi:MAG TPA: hypothetical protein VF892_11325 [Pseudonocardiaceae bacterium]